MVGLCCVVIHFIALCLSDMPSWKRILPEAKCSRWTIKVTLIATSQMQAAQITEDLRPEEQETSVLQPSAQPFVPASAAPAAVVATPAPAAADMPAPAAASGPSGKSSSQRLVNVMNTLAYSAVAIFSEDLQRV